MSGIGTMLRACRLSQFRQEFVVRCNIVTTHLQKAQVCHALGRVSSSRLRAHTTPVWGDKAIRTRKDMTMTLARYDGAHLAPAARLKGHGALRRGLGRVTASREAQCRRTLSGHVTALDDAALATFGWQREEIELAGRAFLPF
jgi:hypothetical protein